MSGIRVGAEALRGFVRRVLEAAGVPGENAAVLADALVAADMQGIGSHGTSRLKIYVDRIEAGAINPATKGRIVARRPAAVAIDGESGIGQVVARRAMEEAVALAREAGIAMAGVRNSNHFGVAGHYCEEAASAGMIGLAFTNSAKGIAPWGGREPYFGTNPIAAAFPVAGRPPVVIDMAASVTARGKVILAAKKGEPIPEGWALDKDGVPTTDPKKALEGVALPVGGPKGYALALLVEVLAAVLTGSAFGPHVGNMYAEPRRASDTGHLLVAIDPGAFLPRGAFLERMATMVGEIEAVPPVPGGDPPRLPGARRRALMERARAEGVELAPEVLEELVQLGRRFGVDVRTLWRSP